MKSPVQAIQSMDNYLSEAIQETMTVPSANNKLRKSPKLSLFRSIWCILKEGSALHGTTWCKITSHLHESPIMKKP
ncbi:MAG: hypothetical protein ACOVNQ_08995 [Pirellula sp.]